jgi:hypothetical protein
VLCEMCRLYSGCVISYKLLKTLPFFKFPLAPAKFPWHYVLWVVQKWIKCGEMR